MSLNLLNEVLEACHAPTWSGNNDAVDLVVEKGSIVFDTLRQLQSNNIYAEGFSNAKIQADFNSNKAGELPLGTKFRLRLPRIVAECVVAKNLADLLSVDSATYREPRSYFLVGLEKAGGLILLRR